MINARGEGENGLYEQKEKRSDKGTARCIQRERKESPIKSEIKVHRDPSRRPFLFLPFSFACRVLSLSLSRVRLWFLHAILCRSYF